MANQLTPEEERRAREALRPDAGDAEKARREHAAAWAELNRRRSR